MAERDDLSAGLELAEEEDVVDEVARLLDLLARLLDEGVDVGARQRRALEQDQHSRERRPELVRDGRREAGAQLLIGGELGKGGEKENDEARVARKRILAHPPPEGRAAERSGGARAGRNQSPLAVEHDDRLIEVLDDCANPLRILVHSSFTTLSPFGDPSMSAPPR